MQVSDHPTRFPFGRVYRTRIDRSSVPRSRSNENKLSRGERKRAWLRVKRCYSCQNWIVRRLAVGCSDWLGGVRNLIHTPQKYIRVAEIREDTNSTLRGQSCRSTPRANANERNSNTATGTRIPNSVTNIHGAGK